ncbi:hypothetical protein DL93DRAFT_2075431 [Clavulina sp. PMI_390]|nr:hypothetical protein DL93DRAFT_2075431 [Clavulina sp. PMI_390]
MATSTSGSVGASSSSSRAGGPVVVGDSQSESSGPSISQAIKTIRPVEDLQALPSKPCTRESLLYGIGTGAAIGGVRLFSSRVLVATNWAVGTFVFIAGTSMYICTQAREAEQRFANEIIKKYPERNIRIAQQRAAERRAAALHDPSSAHPASPLPPNDTPMEHPVEFGDTADAGAPGGGHVAGAGATGAKSTSASSWWPSSWGKK